MAWHICPESPKRRAYYDAQRSFRERPPTKDGARGKSTVRTEAAYLDSAESIVNRLQSAASKEQTGKWAEGLVSPGLLDFGLQRSNGKGFWYATGDVIGERKMRKCHKRS